MPEKTLDDKVLGADFRFLDQNRIDRNALITLYNQEIISRGDAIKYTQAEDALSLSIQARLNPNAILPSLDDYLGSCTIASVAGAFAGFLAGIVTASVSSAYSGSEESSFYPILFGLAGGVIAGAAAGLYKYFRIRKNHASDLAKADDEHISNAYDNYFENVNNIWDNIKHKRTKKGELGEALQNLKGYIKKVRSRHGLK
jgi:hypothetical protein